MDLTTAQKTLRLVETIAKETHPDLTLRQLSIFLIAACAGTSGADSVTIEKKTGSSQATVSRGLSKLGPATPKDAGNYGLVEFTLDQADKRRVYARLNAKGTALVSKMARVLSA